MNEVSKSSKVKKFYIILGMLLLLLIPIIFLDNIVSDRESYKDLAVRNVAASWADSQTIYAPILILNYPSDKKNPQRPLELRNFNADISVNVEMRKKGIFHVPVYVADVSLKGDFVNPYAPLKRIKADLLFRVSDSKGFISQPQIKFAGKDFVTVYDNEYSRVLTTSDETLPFEIKYKIRGLNNLYVEPEGQNNEINITGNWPDPSFQGDFLPAQREVTNSGFKAEWTVPAIATTSLQNPVLGASFLTPVDNYRMAIRAVKYAFLFLSLTFLSFFIFEITSEKENRIHQLQYLMMGGAMLIFYLLLVSISEFLPFGFAYSFAAAMTIGLIGLYTYFVILKRESKRFPVLICAIMALLYLFLYVLLMLQDLSLIIGSFGLFLIMSLVMYSTRNVKWYN